MPYIIVQIHFDFENIVLAFHHPETRKYTDFTIAFGSGVGDAITHS